MGRRSIGLVAAVIALVAATASGQDDGSSREWNQPRGNAARTACVDVAPIKAQPEVAWRLELPGGPVSSPVSWEGFVYVVTKNAKGDLTLSAVRAATGESLATRALGKGEWADLAVLRGTVFVVDPAMARSFKFDGKQFSLGWNLKGTWAGQPAVTHGCLVVADAAAVHLLDLATGRDVVPPLNVDSSSAPNDFAATCTTDGAGGAVDVARLRGTTAVRVAQVAGLGTKVPAAGSGDFIRSPFKANDRGAFRKPREAVLVALGRVWIESYTEGFYADSDNAVCAAILLDRTERGWRLPIWLPPAVVGNAAYAMSRDGTAYAVNMDASYLEMTKPGNRPKGARTASASAARGVVYFGNWALEVDSGRVLWCLPDLSPVTPLIPVGDGRAVCLDEKGVLFGIAEPGLATAVAPADASTSGGAAPPTLPGDADGVLLADGRFIAGKSRTADAGHVKVKPATGDELDLAPGAWALAQDGGGTLDMGEERTVLAAVEEILDRRSAAAWDATFRKYAAVPMVTDALRVLTAAKRDGLSEDRARQLEQLVAGKRDHPNADLQRKRLQVEERALRDAYCEDVRAASKWCRSHVLTGAATVVLGRLRVERPDDAGVESAARELVPAGFPWAKAADAGARWIQWAKEIVPAGGLFVPPDSPDATKKRSAPWDADVILLRTQNVLLVSRSADPDVVGQCLRHAEGAIRACERVLGPASSAATDALMEVRLHADRAAYLAEVTPSGGRAHEWTAGYYTARERVSRFYVPGPDETAVTPLRRGLLAVLAHEVTHQWIDLRWEPRGGYGQTTPGYWAVEGVARFIEDQSVEMSRREERLDDATVESLDVASQVEALGWFVKLPTLLAMSHADFDVLDADAKVQVQLRNMARIATVDPRGVFYQESGSLVFWLLNQRGPEGRAAFTEYLRQRYLGKVTRDGAGLLGFASAEAMEREFRKFLAGLRR